MSEPIQSIAQNNYILHNIDAKKLYVQEPLFTANSGDAVYVGWRPDETVLWEGDLSVSGNNLGTLSEPLSSFKEVGFYVEGGQYRRPPRLTTFSLEYNTQAFYNPVIEWIEASEYYKNMPYVSISNNSISIVSWFNQKGAGITAAQGSCNSHLRKIVGINRKENA